MDRIILILVWYPILACFLSIPEYLASISVPDSAAAAEAKWRKWQLFVGRVAPCRVNSELRKVRNPQLWLRQLFG